MADLAQLSHRLEAIEKALITFKNPVTDPPPDDFRIVFSDLFRRLDLLERQLIDFRGPQTDPSPEDLARVPQNFMRSRLGEISRVNPGWVTDPPPEDFLNVRVLDLIRRYRGGFTDPAPEDLSNVRLADLIRRIPGGGFTDPAPEEIGKLTRVELESQLHKVGTELVRLRSLERAMQDRLGQLEK